MKSSLVPACFRTATASVVSSILLAVAAATGTSPAQPAARLTVKELRVNADPKPLGMDDATPTLSWQISGPGRGVMQKAYRIIVSSSSALAMAHKGDIWDSGDVTTDNTSVPYTGKPLVSRTKYFWTVQSAGNTGTAWSPVATFETAYMSASEWKGSWISGPARSTKNLVAPQGAADDACCVAFKTTVHEPATAGATNVKVVSIGAIAPGLSFTIGSQAATVSSVGTAASITSAAAALEAGATNVKVVSVTGFNAGETIVVGSQRMTVGNVGRAVSNATLSAAAEAGATTIQIALVQQRGAPGGGFGGFGGPGGPGSAATGIQVGDTVVLDGESRKVTAVVAPQQGRGGFGGPGGPGGPPAATAPPAGPGAAAAPGGAPAGGGGFGGGGGGRGGPAQPTVVTLAEGLAASHASGTPVLGLGSGITFSPALKSAEAKGAVVSTPGTGVTFTPALAADAATGTAVARVDQSADYCRPVGSYSNSGACKAILPNYMLRKIFTVDPISSHGKVVSARVYSTGLGWNDMTLNGKKTEANTWMTPGYTSYDQTVLYTTDDVTALIQQEPAKGKTNVIATQLASGRYNTAYNGQNHAYDFAQWRAQEVLRADLYVKYADGTEQVIVSDPTWQVSVDGPVRITDYYDGETYDARRQMAGWNTAAYDASKWPMASVISGPKGRVVAQQNEKSSLIATFPNKVKGVDTFPMWKVSEGIWGVDTLKERQGQPVLSIWGAKAGQVIRAVAVERRNDDGKPDTLANRQDGAFQFPSNMSQQFYISDGTGTALKPEVFAPVYNVQGFQWVQIDANGDPLPSAVHVHVDGVQEMHTALPITGTFTSSNALLNKIYEATRINVASNFTVGQMTDTPTYERDGWTGDTQLMAPSDSYLFNTQRQFLKSAQDGVDSQVVGNTLIVNADVKEVRARGGVGLLIPSAYGYGYCSPVLNQPYACGNSTPSNSFGKGQNLGATPIWDAFLHVLPFEAYHFYADRRPAETSFPAMTQYLKEYIPYWMKAYTENVDKTKHYLVASGLGDWAAPTGSPGVALSAPGGISDNELSAKENTNFRVDTIGIPSGSAYMAYMVSVTQQLASALGRTSDASYFKTMFDNVKKDYNDKWFDASVGYYRDGSSQPFLQAMQALPLGIGLVDAANRIPLETKLVQDVLVTRHGHEEVGIAGSRWIFPALSQAAHDGVPDAAKAAYAIALQTSYPSYGYWVQTLGWTGIGEYWESSSRTRTHEMYGGIMQWMYEDLAGIQAATPGFKAINIRPLLLPNGNIDKVSATYDSVHGRITSAWNTGVHGTTLDVSIPANTTATVYVPGLDPAKVTESGVLAAKANGVTLAGTSSDAVKFTVGSGTYHFRVN